MELIEFKFESGLIKKFVEYPYCLYKDDKNWIPPIREHVTNLFDEKYHVYNSGQQSVNNYLVENNGVVVGRVTAYINKALKDKTGSSIGTVGFFECDNDYDIAEILLDNALKWFSRNNIRTIHGPIDFNIWHKYRFMTKGFEKKTYFGEPYNKEYYPYYFERFGFKPIHCWDTCEIDGKDKISKMISRGKKRFESLKEKGFKFKNFNKSDYNGELKKLYHLIDCSFKEFIDFQHISFENFQQQFSFLKEIIVPEFFVFAYHPTGKLVAFAAGFPDIRDIVKSLNGKINIIKKMKVLKNRNQYDRILFHLIGMIPGPLTERSGLGRALVYYVCTNILEAGHEKLLCSLTSRNNPVQGLLSGYAKESQKEYSLYEVKC